MRMELTCVPRKWRGPLRRDRCTWSRSPPRVSRLPCSPADGRLGRGERWAGPRASLRREKSVSRGPVSRRGVARSREVVFQSFTERAHCSPQGLRRSTVPPGARGGPSPRIRASTGGRLSFDDGRSDRFEVMARGGFDLHFPDDQLNTFSCVSWTFGCRL